MVISGKVVVAILALLMHITFTNSCKSDSHIATSDMSECESFCQQKVIDSDGMATVVPELYDFDTSQCCRCNYERIKNPDPPKEETNEEDNTDMPSYDLFPELVPEDVPLPTLPSPPKAPELDPSTFKPPTEKELQEATDPNFVPQPKNGQRMNYAVILVKGMPWELPLSNDIVTAFVYAFNNITGKPWQYKGAMPSTPGILPASPFGIPPLYSKGMETAAAPPPPVIEEVSETAAAPGPQRRRLTSVHSHANRRLLQDADYLRDYSEETYDYDYDPYQIKYGVQNGNVDPYAAPQDPYAQPQDPYAVPSPLPPPTDPYAVPQDPYAQPQDPYAVPSPLPPPTDPYATQDPYGVVPSPVPVPEPVIPSPPPFASSIASSTSTFTISLALAS